MIASEDSLELDTHRASFGWKLTKGSPFKATSKKTRASEFSSGSSQPREQVTVRGTMERGEGQLCACLRRCQARGMFTRGKGNMEGRRKCGLEDTRKVLGLDCWSLSKEEPGATKKKRDPEKKGRRREVMASQTSH